MAYNEPGRLSESATSLYQELLQQVLATPFAGTRGTFVEKTVRGRRYWYLQAYGVEGKKQHYLGPDSAELQGQMQETRARWEAARDELQQRRELVAMLRAGGAATLTGSVLTVLEKLEQAGVFRAGAVLVGTHAFQIYGNMLGFSWQAALQRTLDVDIAASSRIELGAVMPGEIDLKEALQDADEDFFEVPALDRKHPSTSYKVRGRQLIVDVLTPMLGKSREEPVYIPTLKTAAQPIRFLEYLIEDVQPAVLVGRAGVLVNVPDPARFALHKLLIAGRRPVWQQAKARKDLRQAELLIAALLVDRRGDITAAWKDLGPRGKAWAAGVERGLQDIDSELASRMGPLMGSM